MVCACFVTQLGFRKLLGIASHVQWVPDERTYTLIAFRNLNGPEVEQFCTCSVTQSWILKLCCGARWSRAREEDFSESEGGEVSVACHEILLDIYERGLQCLLPRCYANYCPDNRLVLTIEVPD